MEHSGVADVITAIMSGIATVVSALATLVIALRVGSRVKNVEQAVNGRLDQLLDEREARVQAQALLRAARQPKEVMPPRPATGESGPIIREFPHPPQEED